MSKLTFKTPYKTYSRVSFTTLGPSLTKQEFKKECDIDYILKQFIKTGLMTHLSSRKPHYGDYIDVPEYQSAMNMVADANEAFASLPASIRKRFGNDPLEFLDFVQDKNNSDEVKKMGLGPTEKLPLEQAIAEAAPIEPAEATIDTTAPKKDPPDPKKT